MLPGSSGCHRAVLVSEQEVLTVMNLLELDSFPTSIPDLCGFVVVKAVVVPVPVFRVDK